MNNRVISVNMKLLVLVFSFLFNSASVLASVADDFRNVEQNRLILDPIILNMDGVQGSMIGVCIKDSDEEPLDIPDNLGPSGLKLCLVYFVEDSVHAKARIRAKLKELGMYPHVQIRFQDPFPKMIEQ